MNDMTQYTQANHLTVIDTSSTVTFVSRTSGRMKCL